MSLPVARGRPKKQTAQTAPSSNVLVPEYILLNENLFTVAVRLHSTRDTLFTRNKLI